MKHSKFVTIKAIHQDGTREDIYVTRTQMRFVNRQSQKLGISIDAFIKTAVLCLPPKDQATVAGLTFSAGGAA